MRFADPSSIVQRLLETQSLLLIGEGVLVLPLTLCAERQGSTLHNGYRGSVAVGLAEQTQGGRSTLQILSRFGDLLCLEEGRKQEICLTSVKKVIDSEDLSIQKQELEVILLRDRTRFSQLQRDTEHVEGVTEPPEKKGRAGNFTEGINGCGVVSCQVVVREY